MNRIAKFFHELKNPHCDHCIQELHESRECDSCSTLKMEVARLRSDNERLLDRILNPLVKEELPVKETELKPIAGRHLNWRVKQQMLEQEDRAVARAIRDDKKRDESISTSELEKALDISETERTSQTGK